MLISEPYLAASRELHARGNYGVSGKRWATAVCELARRCEAREVLDYGSGRGTLGMSLRLMQARAIVTDDDGISRAEPGLPFEMIEYDPAVLGKEAKPERADLVVCTDVLEHIEPDCLYAVLDDMQRIARKAVFLVVATAPANKHLADGRNAHLIVEPPDWWLPKIMQRFHLHQFQDLGAGFLAIGVPR